MNAARGVIGELVGLFVEDKLFALAIAVWLAISGAMAGFTLGSPELRGLVLFLGLASILVGGIVRGARTQ
jgi:CBS-domain-containing membrane protein